MYEFCSVACNSCTFIFFAYDKSRDVLQEQDGNITAGAELHKMRPFQGSFPEQYAIVGKNSNR